MLIKIYLTLKATFVILWFRLLYSQFSASVYAKGKGGLLAV